MANQGIIEVLDAQAYEYIASNVPDMLSAIEEALKQGLSPDEIYREVIIHAPYHDPGPFAAKCRAAARHIRRAE